MTKREKITLAATGLLAVLALGTLPGGEKPTGGPADGAGEKDVAAQVRTLQTRLAEAMPSAFDMAVLASVKAPWRESAVYDKSLEGKQTAKTSDLQYTGYVELGSGRLAVVNGYEYQVGDDLEGGGYKVTAISPEAVTLTSLDNGTQRNLPYQGQEASAR